jgi:hypothetical protein
MCPRNVNLRIWSDNDVCTFGLASGGGRDSTYSSMVNKFYNICASKNITCIVARVNTEDNPADDPSRKVMSPVDPSRNLPSAR